MTWENNERLVSQPVRLFWNGWETNTYELQKHGWEISAQQNVQYRRMGLAIRHQEAGMRGMSDTIDWDYWQQLNSDRYRNFQDPGSLPGFNCRLASDIIVNHNGVDNAMDVDYNPIDARPMYTTMERMSIDKLAHFRKIEKPSNEIFLREASLDEIMKMALSKQEPQQEQIRKEMVRQNEINVMKNSQLRANLRLVA